MKLVITQSKMEHLMLTVKIALAYYKVKVAYILVDLH